MQMDSNAIQINRIKITYYLPTGDLPQADSLRITYYENLEIRY